MAQLTPAKSGNVSRNWKLAITAALLTGALLRLLNPADMEWKGDEHSMFDSLLGVGKTEPWPWLGMPSGVLIRNPGMSVWVFLALGKLFQVTSPPSLAQAVMWLNTGALALLGFFALKLARSDEREPWLWATCLAAVNPLLVLYQRKIWAQSTLALFSMLFIVSWTRRSRWFGAFFWGLTGACLGQIHMSGFFFAFGFLLWSLLPALDPAKVRWSAWFLGSLLGALPLLPWLQHLLTVRTGQPMFFGWNEAIQLKFWVFWITDPLGLHLGNTLGVQNGNGIWAQIRDFLPYPLLPGNSPTYLVAVAHLTILVCGGFILLRGLLRIRKRESKSSETRALIGGALLSYGLCLTLSTVVVHRYYLLVTFPLEGLWLAHWALQPGPGLALSRRSLAAIVIAQCVVSGAFLQYIHLNGGSARGDYGVSYRHQLELR